LRSRENTSRTEPFIQPPVRTKRSFAGIIIGILVVLLAISSFITFFTLSQRNSSVSGSTGAATTVTTLAAATTAPSPTATPSPTPTQITYPNMAGFYLGNIHNTYANISSTIKRTIYGCSTIAGQWPIHGQH